MTGTDQRLAAHLRWGCSWAGQEPGPVADYDEYADLYDLEYSGGTVDGEFWEGFARSAGRVLEVGCGTGRLTERMARHAAVTGIDNAREMVARARQRLAGNPRAEIVQADARALPVPDARFDVAVVPFGAFNYLLAPRDQLRAAHELHRVVVPGGQVVVDVAYIPLGHPYVTGAITRRRYVTELAEGRLVHRSQSRLDPQWNVCEYSEVTDQRDGDGRLLRRRRHRHHWHLYTPFELCFLFMIPGFTVVDLYGDYRAGPVTSASERLILVAERSSPDGANR